MNATATRLDWTDFERGDVDRKWAYVQSKTDGDLMVLRCGECGQWSAPSDGHRVDEQGNVRPSVVHVCGAHVWLTLEGWKQPVPAGEGGDDVQGR